MEGSVKVIQSKLVLYTRRRYLILVIERTFTIYFLNIGGRSCSVLFVISFEFQLSDKKIHYLIGSDVIL